MSETDSLVAEFVNELKTAGYWLKPDGKPLKEWVLFERDTLEAAKTAAWDAAWSAKWNAAWSAALDAAWDAAWSAKWTTALDAAEDAAEDAAGDGAEDAAWDVVLFASLIIVRNQDIPFKHFKHANKRMQVWRKGYCLLCDVNDKLYVYAQKKEAGR